MFEQFLARFPSYRSTARLDELRATEYKRLDEQRQVYLDYTGGSLHAETQVAQHLAILNGSLIGIFLVIALGGTLLLAND